MIGLISDFDGTLYFGNENPPVRKIDVKKIHEFQKNNSFILCTGRPYNGIHDLKKYEIVCDYYVLTSGALILDKNFEIIYEKSMDVQLVQNLIDETSGFQRAVQAKDKIYPVDKKIPFPIEQQVIQKADDIPEPAIGLSICTESEAEAADLVNRLNSKYNIQALQNENYVDVVPTGCSKGSAVNWIQSQFHFEHVAAIGDSYNDMDMLEVADTAFTFEKSPASVKSKADYLVSGIAQAIDIVLKRPE